MAWEADSRNAKLKGHVYTSKEASSGGTGAAGGGWGAIDLPMKRLQPASLR